MEAHGADLLPEAEELRRAHLPLEGVVRAGAVPLALAALAVLAAGAFALAIGAAERVPSALARGGAITAVGALLLVLAIGLRRFQSWARVPAMLVSGAAVLALAYLTAFGRPDALRVALLALAALPLAVLSLPKCAFLFSEEYAHVRAATPHLRYRPPPAVWAPILALIAVIAAWIWRVLVG